MFPSNIWPTLLSVLIWVGTVGFITVPAAPAEALAIKYTETTKPGTPVFGKTAGFDENGNPKAEIKPVFPPTGEKNVSISFDITPQQIDKVGGIIESITITILDILNPLKKIKGIFDSFRDLGGLFGFQQIPIPCSPTAPVGCEALVLTSVSPLTSPGVYGEVSFNYSIDPLEFENAGFVSFAAQGPEDQEVVMGQIVPIPEPSSLALFIVGCLGLAGCALRHRRQKLFR